MKSTLDPNKNESPFGQPKTLVLFLVVFLFLFGWQYMVDKMYPKQKPAITTQTGATQVPAAATNDGKAASAPVAQANNSEVKTVPSAPQGTLAPAAGAAVAPTFNYEDDTVLFQISSRGFGLSSYQLKTFKDRSGSLVAFNPKQPLYALIYKGQPVDFEITKSSDFEF